MPCIVLHILAFSMHGNEVRVHKTTVTSAMLIMSKQAIVMQKQLMAIEQLAYLLHPVYCGLAPGNHTLS